MDEVGRQALTNAFIHFIRDTSNPSSYRDSLIYNVDTETKQTSNAPPQQQPLHTPPAAGNSPTAAAAGPIQKCPSAPDIAHHKLDHNLGPMEVQKITSRAANNVDGDRADGNRAHDGKRYE